MQWFWDSTRGLQEIAELTQRFPTLTLHLNRAHQNAVVAGTLTIAEEVDYTVTLLIPRKYPAGIPVLFCNSKEVEWKLDRHVFERGGNGQACLCARSEYRIHWPEGSSISKFIDRLVIPFFVGQFYFDTHGCWPPTGQRSHGKAGVIEAYVELTTMFGDSSLQTIERLLRLLARKNVPQGHEWCPCGSGRRLRNCHGQVFYNLRQNISPESAIADLRELNLTHYRGSSNATLST
jgi:hypothetical protein